MTGYVTVRGAREHNLKNIDRLISQLDGLVESGNTVIVVEHEMRVVAGSDWVIDMGPGRAGRGSGRLVVAGPPEDVAVNGESRTAPYLARFAAATTTRTSQSDVRDAMAGPHRRGARV